MLLLSLLMLMLLLPSLTCVACQHNVVVLWEAASSCLVVFVVDVDVVVVVDVDVVVAIAYMCCQNECKLNHLVAAIANSTT